MTKTVRVPALVLGLLYLCFAAGLIFSAPLLPERVATHFDGHGNPNGWMSRSSHLWFTMMLGIVFPLFVVAICFMSRFLPAGCINIPRREYWLASERRCETFAYLFRHSLWFACLAVAFVLGIHFLILQTDGRPERQLSPTMTLALALGFLAGIAVWSLSMLRHFRRARTSA